MGQFSKVLLAIDKVHTVPQRALDCRPGLGRLKGRGETIQAHCSMIMMFNKLD